MRGISPIGKESRDHDLFDVLEVDAANIYIYKFVLRSFSWFVIRAVVYHSYLQDFLLSIPTPKFTMAVLAQFLLLALSQAIVVSATPFQRRGTIASDEIVGFAETVPSGTVGTVYEAYQPYLYVVNGCVPFPAVDAAGDTK